MLTKEELRQKAWDFQLVAKAAAKIKKWDEAVYNCGYVLEFILKARICVDHRLSGFPETDQEFKAVKNANGVWLKIHDIESLLGMTLLESHVKQGCLNEWSVCLQWSSNVRYKSGKFDKITANEYIRSAVAVLKRIQEQPGLQEKLEALIAPTKNPILQKEWYNPYLKLLKVENDLSDEYGEFALFGVWHRKDSWPYSADVVVSAGWIDEDSRRGVEYVVDAVQKCLPGDQITTVSAIIAINPQHPIVTGISHFCPCRHGQLLFDDCVVNDFAIEQAMIVTCQNA